MDGEKMSWNPPQATNRMVLCEDNGHDYLEDQHSGYEVCVKCGKEGLPHSLLEIIDRKSLYVETPYLRNEVVEVISRLHGGQVIGLHVANVMSYIQNMHENGPDHIKYYLRTWNSNSDLDRALLANIIYIVLTRNDHHVQLETVGYYLEVMNPLLNKAGKMLGIGRGIEHTQSEVAIKNILSTDFFSFHLPCQWIEKLKRVLIIITESAFSELEPIVCAVCINLTKEIKSILQSSYFDPEKNGMIDRVKIKHCLQHLKSINLGHEFRVSGTAIRRARHLIETQHGGLIRSTAMSMILCTDNLEDNKRRIFKKRRIIKCNEQKETNNANSSE